MKRHCSDYQMLRDSFSLYLPPAGSSVVLNRSVNRERFERVIANTRRKI